MSARLSRETRRGQIVSCTLALLADTPIDRITTRQVARELGISQPALFRHFRSRDEIFEAVVRHARAELEQLAAEALGRGEAPLDAISALIGALVGYVAEHPGMPRLLFYDAGASAAASYHGPLAQLVAMQRSLATELLRQAQRAGALDARVDAARAAGILLAALQGLLLQWQLSERTLPLAAETDAMLAFWRAGLATGEPARAGDAAPAEATPAAREDAPALVGLAVQPILEAGREPLAEILAALQRLPDDGMLKIVAPFRPAPLLALLADGEHRTECRELEGGSFGVEVLAPEAPCPEDLRELEAPEPLERILVATAALAPGASYAARTPRHPRMLLPRLAERGLAFEVYDEPDGSALVHVRRPA